MEYTAVVKHRGEWWIGWIEEVPGVNCQERTHEELMQSLAEALSEALELNRQDALAAAVSEERDTIEDVLEPYLIQQGFLARTPRGRVATPRAFEHLGLEPAAAGVQSALSFGRENPASDVGEAD